MRPARTAADLSGPARLDGAAGQGATGRFRITALVWLAVFAVLLANQPGRIFFDTKLGLVIDPVGFYVRLWHLWNPLEWFGTLQDQYIGYAFPMGPVYLLGALARVPVWITERLWLASLFTAGFAGLVRLATELGIGSRRSRIVAGLAFALFPTFTILIGSTSGGLIPGLLSPWAVLPLLTAARGGPLVRSATRSGVAVLCMGGVNATCTLYALILPGLFILTQLTGWRRLRLAGCWVVAVGLATSWWAVPLLLQGRYSFNFLPFIEQSRTTTATMSAAAFLRGSGNWTAYLNFGQPWLAAGWAMVSEPVAILAGAIVAAAGLAGLARRDLPAGAWLRLSLGVAALVALAGYPGPLHGAWYRQAGALLDGVLAPLRSVHKLEPVAAAVLALGIAHVIAVAGSALAGGGDPARRALVRAVTASVTGLVLLGLAYPYLSGQILNPGSFTRVPAYWYRVAVFLHERSPSAPALVVPGVAHGTFLWGETVDDPLEPIAASPWATLGLVPYGGPGSQLLLGSVDNAIRSGAPIPGLAVTLSRSGIRYVVVRNDLSPASPDYQQPATVHSALLSSGFRRVAAFGPLITGAQTDPGAPQVQYVLPAYPAVEVFAAGPATGPPSPVAVLPVSQTVLVNGGTDALLQLAGQRLLSAAPAVMAGDRLVTRPAVAIVTDSLRRADHAFGQIGFPASYTYTASQVNPVNDPLGDPGSQPRQLLPQRRTSLETVAVLAGAATVTASSAGSWYAELPQFDPVNAFDGDPHTVWQEASPSTAVGQWVQVTFSHPVLLPGAIRISLLADGPLRAVPDLIRVTTSAGSRTDRVRPAGSAQWLAVPAGPTRLLRITITGVHGGAPGGPGAGVRDVLMPGISVTRYLQPPQASADSLAAATVFSFQQQLPSPAGGADVAAYPSLNRTFVTTAAGDFRLTASAISVPGAPLDAILSALVPARKLALEISASSTWQSLPSLSAAGLFSVDRPGSWIAGGPNPVIRLRWPGKRTISQLTVEALPGFAAAPSVLKLSSPYGTRWASIGLNGLTAVVPPLRTDQLTIAFPVLQYTPADQPGSGAAELPVGLSRISIPALSGLPVAVPDPGAVFRLPCGKSLALTIDGRRYPTQVTGTAGALSSFAPVSVQLCASDHVLMLAAGRHWLAAPESGPFAVTDLSLTSADTSGRGGASPPDPAAAARSAGSGGRSVRVLNWQAEDRAVRIGPGAAAYLELHQNANDGWMATLAGRPLVPVRLDGWQQGFVVPAGRGGVITIVFRPAPFYHSWIILSAAGALVLLAIALASSLRWRARLTRRPARPEVGGPGGGGPASRPPSGSGRLARLQLPGLLALTVLMVVIGGPIALAVPVLAVIVARIPGWTGVIAFAAMTAAGVLAVFAGGPAMSGTSVLGLAGQACALIALAVTLTPVVTVRR